VVYAIVAVASGLLGGFIGRQKGSSFFLWFLVSACLPVLGPLGAALYRSEREELRRECPSCGNIVPLHDAICTRCGSELEFPDVAIAPESRSGV
jgi:hypothetical protein